MNIKLNSLEASIKGVISRGVVHAEIDEDGHLIFTMSDGTTVDIGEVKGAAGNGIVDTIFNDDYSITLVFEDGERFTTPSLRGEPGAPGDFEIVENPQLIHILTEEDLPVILEQASEGGWFDGQSPTIGYEYVEQGVKVLVVDRQHPAESPLEFLILNGEAADAGISPAISVTPITGGNRVSIVDAFHPAGSPLTFDIMNGTNGSNYVLTQADKNAIAQIVLNGMPIWNGGSF